MKTAKRILSLCLALVLSFSFLLPCLAVEQVTPVIMVTGMNAVPLVQKQDNGEEAVVWAPPASAITSKIPKLIWPTIQVLFTRNWEKFMDKALPLVNEVFEPVLMTELGKTLYDVVTDTGSGSYADNHSDSFLNQAGRDLGQRLADEFGAENTYLFIYDWRRDLYEVAQELNEFVESVKTEHNCDKVDFVSVSMGSVVTNCYLAQFGGDSLENVTLVSPAFTGLSLLGDVFCGRVRFKEDAVYRILAQALSNQDTAKEEKLNKLFSILLKSHLMAPLFRFADAMVDGTRERIFAETFVGSFGRMPGILELIPAAKYQEAKQFLYHGEENAITRITDRYFNEVGNRVEEIYKGIQQQGVKLAIVSCYGRQSAPVYENSDNQSDGTIDSYNTSGFATFAKHGTTLGSDYKQAVDCGHNHLSCDGIVDASTAMFPESTWIIKHFEHFNYEYEGNSCDLILWLTTCTEQATVFDNPEFPQFMEYSYQTHLLTPLK